MNIVNLTQIGTVAHLVEFLHSHQLEGKRYSLHSSDVTEMF